MRRIAFIAQALAFFAASFALVFVVAASAATLCKDKPAGGSHWFYRLIDNKKCWFQAPGLQRGTDKPKHELRWDAQPTTFVEQPPPDWFNDESRPAEAPALQETNAFDAAAASEAAQRIYQWRMREERLRDAFKTFGSP